MRRKTQPERIEVTLSLSDWRAIEAAQTGRGAAFLRSALAGTGDGDVTLEASVNGFTTLACACLNRQGSFGAGGRLAGRISRYVA